MRKIAVAAGMVALLAASGPAGAHGTDTALTAVARGAAFVDTAVAFPPDTNSGRLFVVWTSIDAVGVYEGEPINGSYQCENATGTRSGNVTFDEFTVDPFICTLAEGIGPPTVTAAFSGVRSGVAIAVTVEVGPAESGNHTGACGGAFVNPTAGEFAATCAIN